MAGLLDDEDLLPFFGNPNIARQGARARALATKRDVNTLPDPRTYAAVQGLLGTPPDEMGFSVLNPNYESIQRVARPAFAAGTALGIAPLMGAARFSRPAQQTVAASQRGAVRMPGAAFDPRFDPRVEEQAKLSRLTTDVTERVTNVPQISLVDLIDRPFITSMSDRTGVGLLNRINDVELNQPVNMQGGQPFMFDNPGMVWASARQPAKQILDEAQIIKQVTGKDPVYLPWRMAPTGGDFATMTGESMLAYADAAMNKTNKRKLDRMIKGFIPDWSGVGSDKSIQQFRTAPDRVRKAIKKQMDVNFRDLGGLSIGQARLSVADPKQLTARDAGVMNVGEIFADKPLIMQSGHASYPAGVPGQGIGQLKEDVNVFQLMPNVVRSRGIPDPTAPRTTDIRALQMKPYAGMITEELLRSLGY